MMRFVPIPEHIERKLAQIALEKPIRFEALKVIYGVCPKIKEIEILVELSSLGYPEETIGWIAARLQGDINFEEWRRKAMQ